MHLRQDLHIKESCGIRYIYVPAFSKSGTPIVGQVIRFNEASELLWTNLQPLPDFKLKDAVSILQDNYEIDTPTAEADCKSILTSWIQLGMVEK